MTGIKRNSFATILKIAVCLCLMMGLSQCDPEPQRVPKAYKIDVPDVGAINPTVAVPNGISGDGKVVIGTIYEADPATMFNPIYGFRWTREGGTVLFDDVPGYERLITFAHAANYDGSVIIGNVLDVLYDRWIPWVWQSGKGYTLIEVPEGALFARTHSITPDGEMVFGSFVADIDKEKVNFFFWTEENGTLIFEPHINVRTNAVAMINDGLTVVLNSYQEQFPERLGPWRVENISRDWSTYADVVDIAPTLDLVQNSFYASGLGITIFGVFNSCSFNGNVIGGHVIKGVADETGLRHPAVWLANEERLVMLSGLGYNGDVTAVSPDGNWVGFTMHFGLGIDRAYVWNKSSGKRDLVQLIKSSDMNLGSNLGALLLTPNAMMLRGFSEDNRRAVGVCYNFKGRDDMMGFVIDNFDVMAGSAPGCTVGHPCLVAEGLAE